MEHLTSLWTDPTNRATIIRFLVFIVGVLVKQGTLPTWVDGLGETVGPWIMGSALLISAGQKNEPKP